MTLNADEASAFDEAAWNEAVRLTTAILTGRGRKVAKASRGGGASGADAVELGLDLFSLSVCA